MSVDDLPLTVNRDILKNKEDAGPRRDLTLLDSVCIIVGIIVGAGIYESPPIIAHNVAGPVTFVFVWALGGLLSLIGGLCYAELATRYPQSGGDYTYLTRAFGSCVGFLFSWAQLSIIRAGSIAAMAYVFSDYMSQAVHLGPGSSVIYAGLAVALLSLINILGVREGKWTQNLLTTVKLLGFMIVVLAAFLYPDPSTVAATRPEAPGSFALAMIFIIWTYGGWNEAAYVAAEFREPRRTIPRSLVTGICAVTAVYIVINLAFLYGLGFEGIRSSKAVASDVLSVAMGNLGAKVMALIVGLSALGAVNGLIFTGARINFAMGRDHSTFGLLGRWNRRLQTPAWSLLVQGLISVVLVVALGSRNGFDTLVRYTSAVFWFFFLLTGISLFVLRQKDRGVRRPYSVPGYPLTPILFCASSAYMCYGALAYAPLEALWGGSILLLGLPFYWLSRRQARAATETAISRAGYPR